MSRHPFRLVPAMAAAVAICAVAPLAAGQVYKCTDGAGRATYSDAPCDSVGKPLRLPDDPKGNATNPHMCAQLQDEVRRLGAEARRDTQRGRAEGLDHAKRRQALTARYEARCVGIARSEPKAKWPSASPARKGKGPLARPLLLPVDEWRAGQTGFTPSDFTVSMLRYGSTGRPLAS